MELKIKIESSKQKKMKMITYDITTTQKAKYFTENAYETRELLLAL